MNNPPHIHVRATEVRSRHEATLEVFHEGEAIFSATDIQYESSSADDACQLLVALRNRGLITLSGDEAAKQQWDDLRT